MTNLILSLIAALCLVESRGDSHAVGDNGRAIGVLQIHEIMVDEANRLAGCQRWSYSDRSDAGQSRQMAYMVISRRLARAGYNEPTPEALKYAIRLWNRGNEYYQRVIQEMEKSNEIPYHD